MTSSTFYNHLTPFYHLIYRDWEKSIQQQAIDLDSIIREVWDKHVHTLLDVACGIGTQAMGLASLGYHVTASDLSSDGVARAQREAAQRGLHIDFTVADMRAAFIHHQKQFDLVIACDNSVPHLLTDADLLQTFRQFYACTRTGGGCLISVRDYDAEERTGVQIKPYGIRIEGQTRYLVFQVWEFHGMIYDVALYLVEDQGDAVCTTHVMRTQYYAVSINTLLSLMMQAGFHDVRRIDDRFFQSVIIGKHM